MANIKRANASSITKSGVAISDVPDAPTIGAVTDLVTGGGVTVAYTAAVTGGAATTFTATSSPGGLTGTGSSPITVTGLTVGTAYTFTVTASNSTGTSAPSSASASVTPTTYIVGAYEQIASTTVGSGGSSSITFSGIPLTYQHLQLRMIGKGTATVLEQYNPRIRFNSDTGANYSLRFIRGYGTTVDKGLSTSQTAAWGGVSSFPASHASYANVFGVANVDILDYANTSKYKSIRALNGFEANGIGNGTNDAGQVGFNSGLWMSTSAISSITIYTDTDFAQYSSFSLYGIK